MYAELSPEPVAAASLGQVRGSDSLGVLCVSRLHVNVSLIFTYMGCCQLVHWWQYKMLLALCAAPSMFLCCSLHFQVYKGRLLTGEAVAVKVQRPSIGEDIAIDMLLLRRLMKFVDDNLPQASACSSNNVVHTAPGASCKANSCTPSAVERDAAVGPQFLACLCIRWFPVHEPCVMLLLQVSQPLVPLVDEFARRLFAELDYVKVSAGYIVATSLRLS